MKGFSAFLDMGRCKDWDHKVQFSSVIQSCPTLCDPMNRSTPGLPCPSPTSGVHSNSHPLSRWCHPAISSSVFPFSSCPQSLPASESFPVSQLFTWRGQSIGVSALASFLPKKSQNWSPLVWTGWISLQAKGLSRVFSNTTVQKHYFTSVWDECNCAVVWAFFGIVFLWNWNENGPFPVLWLA